MIIYATQQELNMICIAASLLKIIREITAMYKVHVSIFEKWLTLPTIIYRFIVSKWIASSLGLTQLDPAWFAIELNLCSSSYWGANRRTAMKLMKLGMECLHWSATRSSWDSSPQQQIRGFRKNLSADVSSLYDEKRDLSVCRPQKSIRFSVHLPLAYQKKVPVIAKKRSNCTKQWCQPQARLDWHLNPSRHRPLMRCDHRCLAMAPNGSNWLHWLVSKKTSRIFKNHGWSKKHEHWDFSLWIYLTFS